jgi:hypothetical protein
MNTAEKICQAARKLPEPVARKVLDFIEHLEAHDFSDFQTEHLKRAQIAAMHHIWDSPEDEVWNEL